MEPATFAEVWLGVKRACFPAIPTRADAHRRGTALFGWMRGALGPSSRANDRRSFRLSGMPSWAVAGLLLANSAVADDPPPPASASRPAPRLSAAIREAITASLPKYVEHAAEPSGLAASDPTAATADGVLSLPTMTVQQKRPLPMHRYEFLTLKGRLELARKKFPGLSLGPFGLLNGGVSLAMLQEEMEYEERTELKELDHRTGILDTAASRETAKEMEKALARPNTDWSGASKP